LVVDSGDFKWGVCSMDGRMDGCGGNHDGQRTPTASAAVFRPGAAVEAGRWMETNRARKGAKLGEPNSAKLETRKREEKGAKQR
jgi:hypothetical protein